MTPNDLIYNEVYKQCLNKGCSERMSKDMAIMCLEKFKKNQFTNPSELIKTSVASAVKLKGKKKGGV